MAQDFAFGEFAFSSFRSGYPIATLDSRSNGLNTVSDDDEWGDFVKSPQQSQFADPPVNSSTGKGNSPLAPTHRWVKPSGALPLSFFGAAEEEEEQEGKDAADFNLGRSNVSDANFSLVSTENNASNSKNISAGDLFSHTSQINGENGPDSKSADRFDFIKKESVLVENGFHSISDLKVARSASTGSKNSHNEGMVGRSDQSQLTTNGNNEFIFEANVFDPDHKFDLFGTWSLDLNESSSNSNSANPNVKISDPNLDMNDHTRNLTAHASPPDGDGDDGWEFQDAYSEPNTIDLSNEADFTPHDGSAMNTFSLGIVSSSNEIHNLFEPSKESIDIFSASTRFVDTFAASTAGSHGSQDVELISTQPSKASNYDSDIKENDTEGILNPSPDVESSDFDEDFGEFTAASEETKPDQTKDTSLNFHRSALPMSIFGNEEPECDGCLDAEDSSVHHSNSESDNHTSSKSVISINDLISSLYNQTEKTSLNITQEPITMELNLSSSMTSSNLGNDGDHLDDTSWEFKNAFSQRSGNYEASLYSFGDAHLRTCSKMKLNNHLEFYSKLKEVLCFVSKDHIEHLKRSQGNDSLLGEVASITYLTSDEFQMVCQELEQMDYLFDKQDQALNNSYLSEFIEILLEPQFQILESEYHLSERLLLVEKDLKSAMELIRHTNSMLNILTLGTPEEKFTYISVWSDIISVCAQELKKGASIWTKAAEKHVQSQLLAETQGRNFVLELGEIYRVVVILGASAKLFKPWTISCSIDLSGIYILLEECHALWSTSGLEEALSSASEDASVLKSIKDICGLDETALQNFVFMEKDSFCGLSMLTAGVAPGVKIIKWGEECFFVTIANLWANLISCTPPKLPRLHFGS